MTTKSILVILAVSVLSIWAKAQCPNCVGCHDGCVARDGWSSSPTFGNCSANKDCGVAAVVSMSYLDSGHPGLFTRTVRASLIVTGVIPGSPADKVGIVVGDQILRLNGEDPTYFCSAHQWPSKDNPTSADLVIAHGGTRRQIRLDLIPIRELIAKGRSAQDVLSLRQVNLSNQGLSSVFHGLAGATPKQPKPALIADVF